MLCCITTTSQNLNSSKNVVITTKNKKTKVVRNKKGVLLINVLPKDFNTFKAAGVVYYRDFGAKGDGKTDDILAIAGTHAFANKYNVTVKASYDAKYYIGGSDLTVNIKTDTDFGSACFIIDDTQVQNRKSPVFKVSSSYEPFKPEGVSSISKNQEKINLSLPQDCFITVNNSEVKHFVRAGLNPNSGSEQTDIFISDKNGNIIKDFPLIWDFDSITNITALPIDKTLLKITGGHFTTIANKAESKYNYYSRNISIKRSNVLVDGLVHHITGEGEHGAPYLGFINISNCAYVTIKNTILTGHKTYKTIGNAGKPVSMGSYDVLVNKALGVSIINCSQTNNINNGKYWGIFASNYSKNLIFDNCKFSRFDAHKGVRNATIRNSTIGYMGILATGMGTLTIENSTIKSRYFINLRRDYGSTWQGNIVIRNCTFIPVIKKSSNNYIINGFNSGAHDFGYPCYMPEQITIENFHIKDVNNMEGYKGVFVLGNFNPKFKNHSYQETFPYAKTKEIVLKNMTTSSNKPLKNSENPFMFKDVTFKYE